jgi:hypothetical protein
LKRIKNNTEIPSEAINDVNKLITVEQIRIYSYPVNRIQKYNIIIIIIIVGCMKGFVIPVIIGDTGIVTTGLKKYLETITGKHSIDSLQKKQLY